MLFSGSFRGAGLDLRHAARSLKKTSLSSTVAVVILALGIGASTTLFTLVDAVWLEPLPWPRAERLVAINVRDTHRQTTAVSYPNFRDLREELHESTGAFEELAGFNLIDVNMTAVERPESLIAGLATETLFSLLGFEAEQGRSLQPEDFRPDAPQVVVLTHGFWTRRFGADPDVVGRSITLGGATTRRVEEQPYRIVGVLPETAWFRVERLDLWTPLVPVGAERADRSRGVLYAIGRLAGAEPRGQAESVAHAAAARLSLDYPDDNRGLQIELQSARAWVYGENQQMLALLLAASILLLLLACINVVHIVASRLSERSSELRLRLALGAARIDLVRLLLTEALLIGMGAVVLGLGMASYGVTLASTLAPESFTRQLPAGAESFVMNGRVLVFAACAACFSVAAAGLLPLIGVPGHRGGARSERAPKRRAFLEPVVVSEIALALLLLAGAGVTLQSFRELQRAELGFDARSVISLWLGLTPDSHASSAEKEAFFDTVKQRVSGLAGVQSVGRAQLLPQHVSWSRVRVQTVPPSFGSEDGPQADVRPVDADYLRTMSISLKRGRHFDAFDVSGARPVALVNESLVDRVFPGRDPLGAQLTLETDDEILSLTVIGIVGDVRVPLVAEHHPVIYRPWHQTSPPWMYLLVRTEQPIEAISEAIRRSVWSVAPNQSVDGPWEMEKTVAGWFARPRFAASLLAIFGGIAFLLAAAGVFGVISVAVRRRWREMGIRKCLGARPRELAALIIYPTMAQACIGMVLGVVAAAASSRWLSGLLYHVSPIDPLTLITAAGALGLATFTASYLPARRLKELDPAEVLRSDR